MNTPANTTIANWLPPKDARIAVAMSGGVDSSVVAYLLAKAGYNVVGFTAWTLNGPGKCCNDALVNAGRVCETLGIEYDTVDLRAEFSHYVMDYYHQSYEAGLTPNPCVECNRYVKWEKLLDYAGKSLGADYMATGHYAQLTHHQNITRVFRSVDEHKDQTYMMARVYPSDLSRTTFPLGGMTKPEVVALAKEVDLPTAYSKESQDICFVLDGHANYMQSVFGKRPGPIVDIDTGKILAEHDGVFNFTVGQRKGVKVAAGRPIYVIKTDPKTNTVYVGDPEHLASSRFRVVSPHWIASNIPERLQESLHTGNPIQAMVKIRYNTPAAMGTIYLDGDSLLVSMKLPFSAVTPGQIAAFYDEDYAELWGGGYIETHITQEQFDPNNPAHSGKALPNLFCQV